MCLVIYYFFKKIKKYIFFFLKKEKKNGGSHGAKGVAETTPRPTYSVQLLHRREGMLPITHTQCKLLHNLVFGKHSPPMLVSTLQQDVSETLKPVEEKEFNILKTIGMFHGQKESGFWVYHRHWS
jgi:hypothetical protein